MGKKRIVVGNLRRWWLLMWLGVESKKKGRGSESEGRTVDWKESVFCQA